ncbi:MAG TPA: hypothetical protein PK725_09060 [Rhodocyclaceae bacterium]|jgi:hypothetical protein|nr:hypothetical protein [Rhodocyclaceae bacterium]
MVDSLTGLSNVDASALQSARAPLRPEIEDGRQQGNAVARQDVQVSISAEARAAEQAARLAAPDQVSAAQAVAGTQSSAPVQASTAADTVSATASATATPAAQAEAARADRTTSAAEPAQAAANLQRPRDPDASSAEGNQAVQLYLANATRPDNQPTASVIRESA